MTLHDVENLMTPHLGRVLVGAVAVAAVLVSKYFGQDHGFVLQMLDIGDHDQIGALAIGYALVGVGLLLCASLVCYLVEEPGRMKLLAIGMAVPAIVTTWAGGSSPGPMPPAEQVGVGLRIEQPMLAGLVHAGSFPVIRSNRAWRGINLFFGVGKEEYRYWVIVGSHPIEADAIAQVRTINEAAPYLEPFVGRRLPGNPNYPVIVGEYLPRKHAAELQDFIAGLPGITDSYLSVFADRR